MVEWAGIMSDRPRATAGGGEAATPAGSSGSGRDGEEGSPALLPADLEPTKLVARTLFEHAPVAMLMVDRTGVVQHVNAATERLFGYAKEALVGQPVEILVPPEKQGRHEELRTAYMVHPTSRSMAEGQRLAACRKDGTEISVDIAMNPVVTDTSDVAVILSVIDNSARERADRAEFFVRELTHRARNMFAIIGAISRQIAKHSTSVDDFQTALEHRLSALSASYRVFEKANWQAAPIRDLVRSQIAFVVKQGNPQVDLSGPDLRLKATPAEYLGLAIHELATNAVKHGALSVPSGAVTVRWSVDETTGRFEFHWMEHDGPEVAPADHQGFGSSILKSIVPTACEGTAHLAVTPAGMTWSLHAPLTMIAQAE